ncbi:uncharacterized protein [Watersipora subatra]|uniref:uncharacterized protein n=1 Tax=Watersipora subatra TaxID=2589382 RepID=UPI00355C6305
MGQKLLRFVKVIFFISVFSVYNVFAVDTNYYVGTGMFDVTGPATEINMMGYAKGSQKSNGIHLRQYSRAYVIKDKEKDTSVVFVSIDACMVSTAVKMQVAKRLAALFPGLYNETNVCISSIHTHSGPGGFHQYILLDVTSLGFVKQSLDALVDGIVESVKIAEGNLRPANLHVTSGELLGANINRSPTSYLNNPEKERAKYKYDVDTTMTLVKITDERNFDVGMISWFPVHCTSMNNTNGLISGDNKGLASHFFERDMNPGQLPHQVSFVAAFAQANLGDVSPNTKGPHCMDTGLPCDTATSTCNGRTEQCVASGPGRDMFESTLIIGAKQYEKAKELYKQANITGLRLSGPVDFRHQYVDMSNYKFQLPTGKNVTTCPAAMGYSFAAGTTDGPGDFDFTQGTNSTNKFWSVISGFISKPSQKQVDCQKPKPILLNTGEIDVPYAWQPAVVATQILRVGQLIITALPGEFTTMSGRRMRESLTQVFSEEGKVTNATVVLAGLSNTYADYIATFEEYQKQRYEAASTIYGPHTLSAYLHLFKKMATAMVEGKSMDVGPSPPDLLSKQLSFVLPVVFDSAPLGYDFGQPLEDAQASYKQGDLVSVRFVSADARNNLMTNLTFLTVDKLSSDGSWTTVYTDSHWETKFQWSRTSTLLGTSSALVSWQTSSRDPTGVYRITHTGYHKALLEEPKQFSGTSRKFTLTSLEWSYTPNDEIISFQPRD